jgi:hypothetical protein
MSPATRTQISCLFNGREVNNMEKSKSFFNRALHPRKESINGEPRAIGTKPYLWAATEYYHNAKRKTLNQTIIASREESRVHAQRKR